MLALIIIAATAISLVRWTAVQVWQVLVAMLAGFLLSLTSIAPDIRAVLSQISGGHL